MLLLKSVDYGHVAEILVKQAASPYEFTRLTAITWINVFVKLGVDQLVPYYADILEAILPCISDKEEKISMVTREIIEGLCAIKADQAEGFYVGAILSVARRQLSSEREATRIEILHWISTLLNRHRTEPVQDDDTQPMLGSHSQELGIDIEPDNSIVDLHGFFRMDLCNHQLHPRASFSCS